MKRPLVLLAAALVVATNLGALGLGALNRQTIETDIVLTERELRLTGNGSVTALRLNWMQLRPDALSGEMVTRAGFRVERGVSDPGADEYYARQLPRQAYVALEYDGPAWVSYREMLTREPPQVPLSPQQLQKRRTGVARTVEGHTRLFVVDVDSDAARLRSRHPDRGRYLITAARVRVMRAGAGTGRIPALSVRVVEPFEINVPRPFSATVRRLTGGAASAYGDALASGPRYSVHLRYGRFHEPWVAEVSSVNAPSPVR